MKINNRLRILKYFIIQWVVKIMYKDAEKDKDAGEYKDAGKYKDAKGDKLHSPVSEKSPPTANCARLKYVDRF